MIEYATLNGNGDWTADNTTSIINSGTNMITEAFKAWVGAKYGTTTQQQVITNPNSDLTMQLLQLYMMSQNNKQKSEEKDNTLLYVALGLGALAVFMMMNDNNSRRR